MKSRNKESKQTYWISLFIDKNTDVYFDSFELSIVQET